MINI
jgi:hypothetical protein